MSAITQSLAKKDRDIHNAIDVIEELNQKYLAKFKEDSEFVELGNFCEPAWEIDPLLDALSLHQDDALGYVCVGHKNENEKWEQTWYKQSELRHVLRSYIGEVDCWISQASFYALGHQDGRKEFSRKINNVKSIRAFFVDLDYQKSGGFKDCPPEYVMERLIEKLDSYGLPRPNIIVSSGNGLQIKWILERALDISCPEILALWNSIQEFFVQFLADFGADPQARDAARVLRIPGTVNGKDNVAFGRVVKYIHCNCDPWDLIDFDDLVYGILEREFPSNMEEEQIARDAVADAIDVIHAKDIDVFKISDNDSDEISVTDQNEDNESNGENESQSNLELILDENLTSEQRAVNLAELYRAAESTVVNLHKSFGWKYRRDVSALLSWTKNGRKIHEHYPLYRLEKVSSSCIGGDDYRIGLCEYQISKEVESRKPCYIEACFVPMNYRNTKYAEQAPEEVVRALNAHLSSNGIPLPSLIIHAGGYELEALYLLRSPIKMYKKNCFDRWQTVQKYLARAYSDFGATSVSQAVACSVHVPGTINTQALADGLDPVVKIVFAKNIDDGDVTGGRINFELLCQSVLPYNRLKVHKWKAKYKSKSEHKVVLAAGVDSVYLPLYRARIDDLRAILEARKVNGELPKGSRQTMLHLIMNFRCLAGEISSENFAEEAKKEACNISASWAAREFKLNDLSTLRGEVRKMESGVLPAGKKNWFYIYSNEKLIRLLELTLNEMRSLRSIKPRRTPEEKREARRVASKNYRIRHGAESRDGNISALSRQTGIPYQTLYRYYALLKKIRSEVKSYCAKNREKTDRVVVLKFIAMILNLMQLSKVITTPGEYSMMAVKVAREVLPSWVEQLDPEELVVELKTIIASLKLRKATGYTDVYTLSEQTLNRIIQSFCVYKEEVLENITKQRYVYRNRVWFMLNEGIKKLIKFVILYWFFRTRGRQQEKGAGYGEGVLHNKGAPFSFFDTG